MKTPAAIIAAALLALAAAASGCSGGGNGAATPVPRPRAYPRMQLPDSTFRTADSLPCGLAVNAAARVSAAAKPDGSVWVDVAYPGLGASIHYTFTPVDASTIDAVLDNRGERISLNLGYADARVTTLMNPAGFEAQMFESRSATPVQALATDGRSMVVSLAAYLEGYAPEKADSLQPVAEVLARDVLHALKTLTAND